jgi:hypothetical protein
MFAPEAKTGPHLWGTLRAVDRHDSRAHRLEWWEYREHRITLSSIFSRFQSPSVTEGVIYGEAKKPPPA